MPSMVSAVSLRGTSREGGREFPWLSVLRSHRADSPPSLAAWNQFTLQLSVVQYHLTPSFYRIVFCDIMKTIILITATGRSTLKRSMLH